MKWLVTSLPCGFPPTRESTQPGNDDHVIADLIRNPEGQGVWATTSPNQPYYPSPLMGEESKVRVKTMHQHRHVIADSIRNPEVNGRAHNKTKQPTESPLP